MFNKMRRARADLSTMNALFTSAERIAGDDGLDMPGAEHLLLAALGLGDGIARDVLRSFNTDPSELHAAISAQHAESLRTIGVFVDDNAVTNALPSSGQPGGPYRAQGSLQTAFQHAVALARTDNAVLNSGYLLLAITEPEHGTVARALDHRGIDRSLLRDQTRRRLVG